MLLPLLLRENLIYKRAPAAAPKVLLAALETHLATHLAVLVTCDLLAALLDDTTHPSTSFRSSKPRMT